MRTIALTAALFSALPTAAQVRPSGPELGRAYPAVNGTTIRCPVPLPPSPEQMGRQFDTRPQDLDALSTIVKGMMDPTNPAGTEFRKQQAEQRATDWPFLCRYRDANTALKASGQRPSVVFMGDSITEGWINADPQLFVRNGYVDRGISGQSSSQMVARFYADVVALHPRVVHIMTGTNDIGGATGPITEDESIDNVRAMIDLAQANGIRVVLAAIPPMSRLLPRPEFNLRPVVRALNARLRRLATERGIAFVDYYTPLAQPDGAFDPRYANDGVHPTRSGYAVMEPLAQRTLTNVLAARR
ncbi:GDSL-type esterase/lipase family protein [Sphingomonas endolithica]|uniref:GDSL-type esterase/lipase family protein n=1 Tax=Sphingomonas endolithica TaxID=2972485 RepID=UPI0021AE946C|nr:GDSL-type esterase/lipase family protein [Sphingomonas sp. ZFBP2030]